MKIKLQTGKEVYMEAFHCTPCYAGLLAGVPTKSTNQELVKHLNTQVIGVLGSVL